MTRTRRTVTALTAAGALALGVLPAAFTTSAILAGGEGTTTVTPASSTYADAGTLTLTTGLTNSVTFDADDDGTPEATQTLTALAKCRLGSSGAELLDFVGTVGTGTANLASLSGGSIGVADKNNGTSCIRVDTDKAENLSLALGGAFPDSAFPVLIESATLDVELKQSARILATAFRDDEVVAYFDLAGGTVPKNELVTTDLPYDFDRASCGDAADNGPDSGASDNCAWPIGHQDVLFDELVLTAYSGSFSLEGGADRGSTAADHRSTFDLVYLSDGDLCIGDTYTRGGENGAPDVDVTRLTNADGSPGDCVPYRFTNGTDEYGQFAELLKPAGQEDASQFNFHFVWTVGADESNSSALVPRTVVDFDGSGTDDAESTLDLCPALITTTFDPDGDGPKGLVTGTVVEDVETNGVDLAPGSSIDGMQFACIISQDIQPAIADGVIVPDEFTVKETIYAYGDIVLRKP